METVDRVAQQLTLADGRTLSYAEYGDASGAPMLFFHGTPGSRLQPRPLDEPAQRLGVRVIAPERPGFGASSPKPGRTFGQYADDMRQLADHLGLQRFAVAGVSGGGGYVTACAARLPERVSVAIVIAGMAPATKAVIAQMHARNRVLIWLARWAPWVLGPILGRTAKLMADPSPRTVAMLSKGLPPADVEVMQRPDVLRTFADDSREGIRQGPAASVEELRLYTRPYDFALEDIRVPVHLFHGEADGNVPVAVGRDVAGRIPDCTATFIPDAGHMWFLDHLDEILVIAKEANRN